MKKTPPSADDLQQLRDELRAEIREARETLKDLRHEIRDARVLFPLLTDELFAAEVKRQVDALSTTTAKAMDESTARVIATFDTLRDLLLGQDRQSLRAGKASIPDLLGVADQLNAEVRP